jgi:DNA polymerase-3 subunit epsilon
MGFIERFRSRTVSEARQFAGAGQNLPIRPEPRHLPAGGFAVIDVETTGLSPNGDRILELAIIRTDTCGRVVDEWVSRFNPQGPVGATHIHGITAADVAGAPVFAEILPELNVRLAGLAMVAHNARFDLGFLRAEFARAGWALPFLPSLCTLEASRFYLPDLDRRRLPDCCAASGIRLVDAHSAMGDARATATLLASYLDPDFGHAPLAEHLGLPTVALAVIWPTAPGGVTVRVMTPTAARRTRSWRAAPPAPKLVELIAGFSLVDALDEGAPQGSLAYLETLAEVLEDGQITTLEAAALADVAALYDLSPADIEQANRGFLLALAHGALDDGKVSQAERAELYSIAELLRLDRKLVVSVLDDAECARHARLSEGLKPLPEGWSHGEALHVGDKVAFTGCEAQRERLEELTQSLGVRVMSSVTRNSAMLVSDGSMDGTKAASAADLGTRVVHPDEFEVLLIHLQPARP